MRGSASADGQVPSDFIITDSLFRTISLFLIDNHEGGRSAAARHAYQLPLRTIVYMVRMEKTRIESGVLHAYQGWYACK